MKQDKYLIGLLDHALILANSVLSRLDQNSDNWKILNNCTNDLAGAITHASMEANSTTWVWNHEYIGIRKRKNDQLVHALYIDTSGNLNYERISAEQGKEIARMLLH